MLRSNSQRKKKRKMKYSNSELKTLKVNPEIHRELKIHAAKETCELTVFVEKILTNWLQSRAQTRQHQPEEDHTNQVKTKDKRQ